MREGTRDWQKDEKVLPLFGGTSDSGKKYGKIVQRTAAVILCGSTAKEFLRHLVCVIGQRCGTGAEQVCCFAFRHGGH